VQHVSCLIVYKCGALRQSTVMEKVKQVRADGLITMKDGCEVWTRD
jgi:hypothetical protein